MSLQSFDGVDGSCQGIVLTDTLPPAETPAEEVEGAPPSPAAEEPSSALDLDDIMNSTVTTSSPSVSTTPPPTPKQKYYEDFTSQTCNLKVTSTMQRWDTGYDTEDVCCLQNFGSKCNTDRTDIVNGESITNTQAPSLSPAMLYYVNFDQRTCIQSEDQGLNNWGMMGYIVTPKMNVALHIRTSSGVRIVVVMREEYLRHLQVSRWKKN